MRVQLDDVAYAFAPDHRIRVSVSTAYWPMVWPSPESVTLTIHTGKSLIDLPVRPARRQSLRPFPPPEVAPALATEILRAKAHHRNVKRDQDSGETIVRIVDDFGEQRNSHHGLTTSLVARENYRVLPSQPLSARADIHWTVTMAREDWRVRTETRSEMWADRTHFYIHAGLTAYEGRSEVYSRHWDRKIRRDLV